MYYDNAQKVLYGVERPDDLTKATVVSSDASGTKLNTKLETGKLSLIAAKANIPVVAPLRDFPFPAIDVRLVGRKNGSGVIMHVDMRRASVGP